MDATVNLAAALRQLRSLHDSPQKLPYRSAETYLWIDAICINQADIEEKNYQVPLMADIYSAAARVLVWLGPGDQGTDRFMDWLLSSWRPAPGSSSERREAYVLNQPASSDLYWLSLSIFLRQWFSRIWIVQEAVLPEKDPLVMCGSRTISFAHLDGCLRALVNDHGWMGYKPPSPRIKAFLEEHVKDFDNPGDAIQQVFVNNARLKGLIGMRSSESSKWLYSSMEQALLDTMHHEATNTRDKIYGLLGIINEKSRRRVIVDYKLEVWQISSQAIIANSKTTGFLQAAISQRHRSNVEIRGPLPSWLPDFTQKPCYESSLFKLPWIWRHYHGEARPRYSTDHKVLTVTATMIDTVQMTKLLDFDPYEGQDDLREIERMANTAQMIILGADHPLYSIHHDLRVELWVVLMLNTTATFFSNLDPHDRVEKHRSLYKLLVDGNPQDKPKRPTNLNALSDWYWTEDASLSLFTKEMHRLTHNLSFIATSNGFIGIGPRNLESGDRLAILEYTSYVVALRPRRDTETTKYVILGPVFIAGLSERYGMLEKLGRDGKLTNEKVDIV
ncbi:hypothetical protein PFICI_00119 [Pestalotiopsis fici W106-1]|uniref:Heterokaryon incompatibility domain-containing protein n=1 Tax=Pestalotiopsis fici (strain W106-1 / CGMCC3.15140) TaxID=1229662 RepID=W3XM13_PESFW|nr:uncharacterized protein PFICI_00119 [Pestalotiopsis fici W106-1]ETS86291.1 hypothetical protein PFICI_00119 [Pestalotiopsis fici W106-1]